MPDNSTTDPEVLAAWPDPCPHCGREWERCGFMEWELQCECEDQPNEE